MPTIEKRGEKSFRLVVDIGTKSKRKRKVKTIRIDDPALLKTTKKLRNYLESEWYNFKTEVEAGAYITPHKRTFNMFIEDWEKKYAYGHLDDKTLETYEYIMGKEIKSYFARK
ncbi:hypothetical protein [Bacillus mojavensis]|uniref:hypothetical protein n=1 Tax=Bacillus mojavensis TaxID=72360 RepID=UPI002DB7987A|nr:hypothetical protein [Bacillus mojavensis]MEC1756022.1 hypothetical protein [Bacillus mojavensis]